MAAAVIAAFFAAACSGGGCHTSVSKSWDASYSVSFGGAPGVDAGAPAVVVDASVAAASVDASVDVAVAAPGAPDAAFASPSMLGVFHRNEGPDERNIEIDPDGTFFWRIYGCDFGGGDCGVWSAVGTGAGTNLVLTPKPPATTMTWDDGVTFARKVTKVVVRDRGGSLEMRVFAADGEKPVQAWYPGRVCAPCGGGLGPSGKLAPCTKPMVRNCP